MVLPVHLPPFGVQNLLAALRNLENTIAGFRTRADESETIAKLGGVGHAGDAFRYARTSALFHKFLDRSRQLKMACSSERSASVFGFHSDLEIAGRIPVEAQRIASCFAPELRIVIQGDKKHRMEIASVVFLTENFISEKRRATAGSRPKTFQQQTLPRGIETWQRK
jgi:hypothetical protein